MAVPGERPPHRDSGRSPEERARDLLARMTLAEKLAQLGCVWSTHLVEGGCFSRAKARGLLAEGTGHITRIGASTGLRPGESAAFANRIQRFLLEETRLGIPAIVHEESRVTFHLDPSQLAFHGADVRLVVEPGEVRVWVGASSEDLRAEGRFEIAGPPRALGGPEHVPTRVEVR